MKYIYIMAIIIGFLICFKIILVLFNTFNAVALLTISIIVPSISLMIYDVIKNYN